MPERDCRDCKRQKEWGCRAFQYREYVVGEDPRLSWVRPAATPLRIDDEEIYACPRSPLLEEPHYWSSVFKYYGFYKKGFLPQKGALEDQSNKAMELFRVLDSVNHDCDEAEQKKRDRPRGDPYTRRQGA